MPQNSILLLRQVSTLHPHTHTSTSNSDRLYLALPHSLFQDTLSEFSLTWLAMYGTRGQLARLLKYATPSKDSHPGTEAKTEIKSEPNDVSTDPMDCDEAAGSTTDQGYSSPQEYIRKLQNTVATLESDLKKSKNLRNKQSREIHKLRDSVKRSSMHIADLKKSQAENTSHPNQSRQDLLNQIQALEETLQEQYDEFTQDNDELAHRLSALQRLRKDERTYLTEKNQDLLHQLEKTQADLHSTSNDLRKIQDSIFTRSHSEWPVEDDCKIREDVARISRDIRAWAKTYGASGESIPTRPIVVASTSSRGKFRVSRRFLISTRSGA